MQKELPCKIYTFASDRQPQENLHPKEYLSKKRDTNFFTFCEAEVCICLCRAFAVFCSTVVTQRMMDVRQCSMAKAPGCYL